VKRVSDDIYIYIIYIYNINNNNIRVTQRVTVLHNNNNNRVTQRVTVLHKNNNNNVVNIINSAAGHCTILILTFNQYNLTT
jgi:hypothetical protein